MTQTIPMIKTTVKNGLPCLARITHITGQFILAKTDADPNSCYEAEWPEIEWELLTAKGKQCEWLQKIASAGDIERIENELLESLV
jgi:hypothetical protein